MSRACSFAGSRVEQAVTRKRGRAKGVRKRRKRCLHRARVRDDSRTDSQRHMLGWPAGQTTKRRRCPATDHVCAGTQRRAALPHPQDFGSPSSIDARPHGSASHLPAPCFTVGCIRGGSRADRFILLRGRDQHCRLVGVRWDSFSRPCAPLALYRSASTRCGHGGNGVADVGTPRSSTSVKTRWPQPRVGSKSRSCGR